jgi:hypothetical protein
MFLMEKARRMKHIWQLCTCLKVYAEIYNLMK